MANEYASIVDLLERLNIDEADSREGQLLNILESASRWVDHETGHRFYLTTTTRYYNALQHSHPSHAWELDTLEHPWGTPLRIQIDDCTAVTTVATDEDGDGTYERTWTVGSDYWLGPRNAPADGQPYRYLNRTAASGRYLFPLWEESIAVTGSFGWCALASRPADIRELTLMVAEWMGTTLTDLAQPGVQTYNITQQLSVVMGPDQLPAAGQKILNYYRGTNLL